MNRFDICEAWFVYLNESHQGQGCPLYARLSKLTSHFQPRSGLCGADDLTEEGHEVYDNLVASGV